MGREVVLVGIRSNLLEDMLPIRELVYSAVFDFKIVRASDIYKSEGLALDRGWLAELWVVLRIETEQSSQEVATKLKRWVTQAGEAADIEFLTHGNQVHLNPKNPLPSPQLHRMRIFLQCAAEVEPHFVHPILGQTLIELVNNDSRPLNGEFFAQGRLALPKSEGKS